jgi:transcriptional enhancer factor
MANPTSLSDFVRMSAVDDLSYPLACDDRTRDAVNTIVSGRKSWKTLKGKGEAVWPPYLEAALIEGLPSPPLLPPLTYPLPPPST